MKPLKRIPAFSSITLKSFLEMELFNQERISKGHDLLEKFHVLIILSDVQGHRDKR
jgi:hypothetical protein